VDVGDENSAGGVAGAEHLRIQVNAQKTINFKMKTENCRIYSYIDTLNMTVDFEFYRNKSYSTTTGGIAFTSFCDNLSFLTHLFVVSASFQKTLNSNDAE
jgi:hypothetical protein